MTTSQMTRVGGGVCFVSYSRKRSEDVKKIVSALHEHGIPTWQDITDLGSAQTEGELREVLKGLDTASAILFVTPEVEHSDFIRRIEAPLMFERWLRRDGFSLIVVAAGGVNYQDVSRILGPSIGPIDPATWNIRKFNHDPITDEDARSIAELTLDQRLAAIDKQLSPGDPLDIKVVTRGPSGKNGSNALLADFSHCFDGRLASTDSWEKNILPGLNAIKKAIRKRVGGRTIHCSGTMCLAAAVALGVELMPQAGLQAVWIQDQGKFGLKPETWSLTTTGIVGEIGHGCFPADVSSSEVALLVSVPPYDIRTVTDDVRATFGNSIPFRGMVHVFRDGDAATTAADATHIARLAVDEVKKARSEWKVRGTVHLFLAVPSGIAFMIGQQLNGLNDVQTYEFLSGRPQPYAKAALLQPSDT